MKTHQELVEEVYRDTNFKSEFASYAKLQNTLKESSKAIIPSLTNPEEHSFKFVNYLDLVESQIQANIKPDAEPIAKCKRGIALLYSSLFKGISTSYRLQDEAVRLIILDVAERYA